MSEYLTLEEVRRRMLAEHEFQIETCARLMSETTGMDIQFCREQARIMVSAVSPTATKTFLEAGVLPKLAD